MTTIFKTHHLQAFRTDLSGGDWFDAEESEYSDVDDSQGPFLALPDIHFDPLTNIKTTTRCHISTQSDHKIRTTTRIRISSKHASQERILLHSTYIKFGLEDGNPRGVDKNVTSLGDDIPFYIGPDWREVKAHETLESGILKSVICRICRAEHYTMKCRYKHSLTPLPKGPKEKKKYIPPNNRCPAISGVGISVDKTNCLRISYLSRQITEHEFIARFAKFGKITRVFLPKDYTTGEYKGYGYITFLRRANAQRAMEVMDRRGYDNLIMRVAWDDKTHLSERLPKMSKN
jgi:translation initiation factor 3 subunit G